MVRTRNRKQVRHARLWSRWPCQRIGTSFRKRNLWGRACALHAAAAAAHTRVGESGRESSQEREAGSFTAHLFVRSYEAFLVIDEPTGAAHMYRRGIPTGCSISIIIIFYQPGQACMDVVVAHILHISPATRQTNKKEKKRKNSRNSVRLGTPYLDQVR